MGDAAESPSLLWLAAGAIVLAVVVLAVTGPDRASPPSQPRPGASTTSPNP